MEKRKSFVLIAAALGLGLTTTAMADSIPDDNDGMPGVDVSRAPGDRTGVPGVDVDLYTVDADRDATITRMEAEKDSRLVSEFSTLDSNRDGRLSKNEYESYYANNNPGRDDRRIGDGTIGNPTNDNPDVEGTTDDSVPGNPDELGPGR